MEWCKLHLKTQNLEQMYMPLYPDNPYHPPLLGVLCFEVPDLLRVPVYFQEEMPLSAWLSLLDLFIDSNKKHLVRLFSVASSYPLNQCIKYSQLRLIRHTVNSALWLIRANGLVNLLC